VSYRWILFGLVLAALGTGAWYYGRPVLPRVTTEKITAAPPPPAAVAEAPKDVPPLKVIEVIDLARAFEPVRDPEQGPGEVLPASYVSEPVAPAHIPYATDYAAFENLLVRVGEADTGSLLFGGPARELEPISALPVEFYGPAEAVEVMPREVPGLRPEKIDVMPREVSSGQ
jgi:hypothetical protein